MWAALNVAANGWPGWVVVNDNVDSETAFLDSFYEKIPFKTEG